MIVEKIARKNPDSPSPVKRPPMFASLALLDQLLPQSGPGKELPAKLVPSARLGMMEAAFSERANASHDSITFHYDQLLPFARKFNCTQEDLDLLTKAILPGYYDRKLFSYASGLFISALLNSSSQTSFTISLSHLDCVLDALCYKNSKQILVVGNAGNSFGCRMLSGSIYLSGSADWQLGKNMKGGKITVSGNVGQDFGYKMQNGRINIHGDARIMHLGHMKGGEVHIDGYVGELDMLCAAFVDRCQETKIYQRGRLLVSDEKIVAEPINE